MKNWYEYRYAVKGDVLQWLYENPEILTEYSDRDELEQELNDLLFCEDSITGNASGSYTFNRFKAMNYVSLDYGTVLEALEEFDFDPAEVGNHFMQGDMEWFDVITRCYCLPWAISEALDYLSI